MIFLKPAEENGEEGKKLICGETFEEDFEYLWKLGSENLRLYWKKQFV